MQSRVANLVLVLAVLVVVGVSIVLALGSATPVEHSASGEIELAVPATQVWDLIRDIEGTARWRPDVEAVAVIGHRGGREIYEQTGRTGTVRFVVESERKPHELITRIVDSTDFGGIWTYRLTETPSGVLLSITEDGEIYNPVFRFFARYLFGYDATLESYLHDLQKEMQSVRMEE